MNPARHIVSAIDMAPLVVNGIATSDGVYTLRLRYSSEGQWQQHLRVYVPAALLQYFHEGRVSQIYMEDLPTNSPESLALPGGPDELVVGVELDSGAVAFSLPIQLRAVWRSKAIWGFVCLVAGVSLLAYQFSWAGALALVVGSHFIRTLRTMPKLPFSWFSTYAAARNSVEQKTHGV
jgi:hypothetical protein